MKDRIPKYAGRIKLVPVDEANGIYDMVRADEPIEEGTPLNKSTLLTDETVKLVGLDENATVEDVLNLLISTLWYEATEGIAYELDGDTYVCVGIGTATENQIVIASRINNKAVKSIGTGAFQNNQNITSVFIQRGIKRIDKGAFSGCTNLSSVAIPNSVTLILPYAFEGCTNLSSVIFPSNLIDLDIDYTSFDNCSPLLFTEYGNCIYMRDGDAPYAVLYKVTDKNMSAYTIHESTKMIGGGAFAFCHNFTSITIPNSVVNINTNAFLMCNNLTSIVIGNGVTKVPDAMAMMCPNLTSVTIPNSVTSIGAGAFIQSASLTTITIPSSVTSIGMQAFGDCPNLTKINVGWAEGAVAGAPWGATNATIHYNSEV